MTTKITIDLGNQDAARVGTVQIIADKILAAAFVAVDVPGLCGGIEMHVVGTNDHLDIVGNTLMSLGVLGYELLAISRSDDLITWRVVQNVQSEVPF